VRFRTQLHRRRGRERPRPVSYRRLIGRGARRQERLSGRGMPSCSRRTRQAKPPVATGLAAVEAPRPLRQRVWPGRRHRWIKRLQRTRHSRPTARRRLTQQPRTLPLQRIRQRWSSPRGCQRCRRTVPLSRREALRSCSRHRRPLRPSRNQRRLPARRQQQRRFRPRSSPCRRGRTASSARALRCTWAAPWRLSWATTTALHPLQLPPAPWRRRPARSCRRRPPRGRHRQRSPLSVPHQLRMQLSRSEAAMPRCRTATWGPWRRNLRSPAGQAAALATRRRRQQTAPARPPGRWAAPPAFRCLGAALCMAQHSPGGDGAAWPRHSSSVMRRHVNRLQRASLRV